MRRVYGWCYDPYDRGWGGRVQPGAKILQDFILEKFPTAMSFGILRDRNRCGKSSAHCYGRAGDVGNYENGRQVNNHPDGQLLAEWLTDPDVAQAIGIQRVIWGGKPREHDWEWDSRAGQRYRSQYHGPSHDDHVHWELCWAAAKNLTREQVEAAYDRYFKPPKKEWDEMASKEEIAEVVRGVLADDGPEIFRSTVVKALTGKDGALNLWPGTAGVQVREGETGTIVAGNVVWLSAADAVVETWWTGRNGRTESPTEETSFSGAFFLEPPNKNVTVLHVRVTSGGPVTLQVFSRAHG